MPCGLAGVWPSTRIGVKEVQWFLKSVLCCVVCLYCCGCPRALCSHLLALQNSEYWMTDQDRQETADWIASLNDVIGQSQPETKIAGRQGGEEQRGSELN